MKYPGGQNAATGGKSISGLSNSANGEEVGSFSLSIDPVCIVCALGYGKAYQHILHFVF